MFNNLEFRIEKFGSSEYMSGDVTLRNKEETLQFLENEGLHGHFHLDLERLWKETEDVSITNLRLPFELLLEYTYKCPLKCKYCYSSSGPDRNEIMTFEMFKNIVHKINKEDIFDLFICGGEPFWNPEYIKYMLENIQNKSITISTNGMLFKEEYCEWCKNSKNDIVISLGIDGHIAEIHNATRGGFDLLCKTLESLNKNGIPIIATTCVTNFNYAYLNEIVEFLISNNIKSVQLLHAQISHLSKSTQEELSINKNENIIGLIRDVVERYRNDISFILSFKLPTKLLDTKDDTIYYGPCTAGITRACINVNGNLVPCSSAQFPEQNIDDSIEKAYINLKRSIEKSRNVSYNKQNNLVINNCCSPE